ncbi:hypothetical protein VPH35_139364 [Triticum aestivum]
MEAVQWMETAAEDGQGAAVDPALVTDSDGGAAVGLGRGGGGGAGECAAEGGDGTTSAGGVSHVAMSFLVPPVVLCSWRTPSSQTPKYSNAGIGNTDNTCSWCCSCYVAWTCTHVRDSKVTFVLLVACMYGLRLCM